MQTRPAIFSSLALCGLLLTGPNRPRAQTQPAQQAPRLRDRYVLDSNSGIPSTPVRIPEGIAFDPLGGDFYATAVFGGRITSIDAQTGIEQTFYQETNPNTAFVGAKVAPFRRVLWVCAIDVTTVQTGATSEVVAFSIGRDGQGQLIRRLPLPSPFFCNDLSLDDWGNVFVTNTHGAAVLRIRPRALWDFAEGAEVFAQGPELAPTLDATGQPVGMNGIAVTPDNQHLIVARGLPAQLLRIPLANPSQIKPVELSGDNLGELPGAPPRVFNPDGVAFVRGKLYVVFRAGVQQVSFSGRGYERAQVQTTIDVPYGLSTAAAAYQHLYVVDSEIHVLANDPSLPIELPHQLVRIPLARFDR